MTGLGLAARIVLAAVLLVAGTAKLADVDGSRRAVAGFGVPRPLAGFVGTLLPVIELAIGVALLIPGSAWWGAIAATALLALFIVGIVWSTGQGEAPDCHCFGQLHSAPVGPSTLVRNGILVGVAGVVLVRGPGASELSPVAWVDRLAAPELVLACVAACLIVVVAVLGWFLTELFRQNGRILARVEALEQRLGAPPSLNGNRRVDGLAVGAPAPGFELPSVGDGRTVSLRSLLEAGRPVLLVFSDPRCGPCEALLPDVAHWQREGDLTVVVLSRGDLDENERMAERHGLSDVLVQSDREVARSYHTSATPSAVLVSTEGRIAAEIAVGASRIQDRVEKSTPASAHA